MSALPADCDQVRERISAIMGRWAEALDTRQFRRFDIEYDYQYKDGSRNTVAECFVKWQYLDVNVTFYLPACCGMSDDELEYMVVHECMHALVNEMRHKGQDHEERVCTMLAMAFRKTRNLARDGHWPPVEAK